MSESKFSRNRVLFLSMDNLAVYHWHNQKIIWPFRFDVTTDGMRHFTRYLQETPYITTRLLVDLVQEEYRQDIIPHISGSDRKAIMTRKKQQFFGGTPYFHAEILECAVQGRRDDIILYSALTAPDIIRPWVKILMENRIPLTGIYSLSQLTGLLLDYLPGNPEQRLVVSMQSSGGLRLSFYLNNKLRMSRLVDLPYENAESCARHIRNEIDIMLRYLSSMHLSDDGQPLTVCCVSASAVNQYLQKLLANVHLLQHHFTDVGELAVRLGLYDKISVPYCDQLLVYLLFTRRVPNYYATRNEMRFYRRQHTSVLMHTVGTAMICGGLLWGSLNYLDGKSYGQQTAAAIQKAEYFKILNQLSRKHLPDLKVSPANLMSLHEITSELSQLRVTPFDMLRLVSNVMDQFPMIQLEQIIWNTRDNLNENAAAAGQVKYTFPANSTITPGVNKVKHYQMATLNGYIHPFYGDYRKALDIIDAFMTALRNNGYVHDVSILSLPLEVGPETNLEGSSDAIPDEARFSIRIIMGLANEK